MSAKAEPAGALEQVRCSASDVCAAKAACLAAARPTVHGIAEKSEVEGVLDDLEGGKITREQAASMGLSAKLDEASRSIEEGRSHLAECDAAVGALRLKYGF